MAIPKIIVIFQNHHRFYIWPHFPGIDSMSLRTVPISFKLNVLEIHFSPDSVKTSKSKRTKVFLTLKLLRYSMNVPEIHFYILSTTNASYQQVIILLDHFDHLCGEYEHYFFVQQSCHFWYNSSSNRSTNISISRKVFIIIFSDLFSISIKTLDYINKKLSFLPI